MDTAEKTLTQGAPQTALQSEQRALQQLQRAEAVFREIQVSMSQGGGGGGGGQKTDAQDLADIFELQKDRLRQNYETVQRGQQQGEQQQQADNQVDATLEKLKQLAARQQQENDRARRKADSLSQMGRREHRAVRANAIWRSRRKSRRASSSVLRVRNSRRRLPMPRVACRMPANAMRTRGGERSERVETHRRR